MHAPVLRASVSLQAIGGTLLRQGCTESASEKEVPNRLPGSHDWLPS